MGRSPRSKKSAGATFDLTFQDVWQSKRILEDAQFLATATTITSTHSAAAAASASAAAAAADTHNSTILLCVLIHDTIGGPFAFVASVPLKLSRPPLSCLCCAYYNNYTPIYMIV